MIDLTQLASIFTQLGGVGILLVVLYLLMTGKLKWKADCDAITDLWQQRFDEMKQDRDDFREIAFKGVTVAEKAATRPT